MNKKWNGEWMWAILVWNRIWETMGVGVQVWIGVNFYTQTTFLKEGQGRIGGEGLTGGAVKIEETEMIKQWRWIAEVALIEEPLFKCSRILSGLRTDRVGARTPILLFFALINLDKAEPNWILTIEYWRFEESLRSGYSNKAYKICNSSGIYLTG